MLAELAWPVILPLAYSSASRHVVRCSTAACCHSTSVAAYLRIDCCACCTDGVGGTRCACGAYCDVLPARTHHFADTSGESRSCYLFDYCCFWPASVLCSCTYGLQVFTDWCICLRLLFPLHQRRLQVLPSLLLPQQRRLLLFDNLRQSACTQGRRLIKVIRNTLVA